MRYLLGDQEVSFLILKKLIQLQDIWMVHLLQNIYLVQQLLLVVLRQRQLVDDFHCT